MADSSDESTKKGGDQLLKGAAELEARGDLAADRFNEMSRDKNVDS